MILSNFRIILKISEGMKHFLHSYSLPFVVLFYDLKREGFTWEKHALRSLSIRSSVIVRQEFITRHLHLFLHIFLSGLHHRTSSSTLPRRREAPGRMGRPKPASFQASKGKARSTCQNWRWGSAFLSDFPASFVQKKQCQYTQRINQYQMTVPTYWTMSYWLIYEETLVKFLNRVTFNQY